MKKRSVYVSTLLSKIKNDIDKSCIISFDIFDTLLLRPYSRPEDLFYHLEKIENKHFFAYSRREAEKAVRLKHPELADVTFDMIYNELDKNLKSLKPKEMALEEQVLRVNPEIKSVYDYAKSQGKKIVIASDMYLPTEFIAKILNKNGYDGWEKLYVSGDLNKTKAKGTMYKQILDDFSQYKPSEIFHIGDNKRSDFKIPTKLGIKAFLYPQVVTQYLNENRRLNLWYEKNKDFLGASILLAQLAYHYIEQKTTNNTKINYWSELGYSYAGPITYGYTRFIEKEAYKHNLKHLLFVARDGYTLQKVFNTFNQDIANNYVYAPRFLNLIYRLDYNKENKKNSAIIIDYYKNKSTKLNNLYEKEKPTTAKEQHTFIQTHINDFLPLSTKTFANYKKYLTGIIKTEEAVGLVDLITGEFSSQKLIQSCIPNKVYGFYWSVLKNIKQQFHFDYIEYKVDDKYNGQSSIDIYTKNWDFMEFLITSTEHPIVNISDNGAPIYKDNINIYEKKRSQIYEQVSQEAVQFANDIKKTFNGYDIYLEANTLIDFINNYIDYPNIEDKKNMQDIKIGQDGDHEDFIPLFCTKISLSNLLHFKNTIKILRNISWRTFAQNLLLCLAKPLSVKTRGLKKVTISFFPYLHKQYFKTILKFNENCFYQLLIGNTKS